MSDQLLKNCVGGFLKPGVTLTGNIIAINHELYEEKKVTIPICADGESVLLNR